jgi:nicotinamidase/pyrazinamidase
MRYGAGKALVVVDCQNDFADPAGSLFVAGGDEVVATVNREVVSAIAAGSPVFYTQDWHPESTPHFEKDGGIWPVHCVGGTWGAELHPRLLVAGPTVRKGVAGEDGYSGFSMRHPDSGETTPTELADLLSAQSVDRITVVGLALDYCVKATALDGIGVGLKVEVPLATTAAVNLQPTDADAAVAELTAGGVACS